ncbi:MAG TPA: Ig-like domain-containing protein [Candidatus Levybacteria bacterium]|nr:Ig-like domain-containing protein [Candidatus Levybacteria bacterium]
MKKPIWEKRIPTLFALLLVAGSIFLTGFLLQQQTSTTGRASQDTEPAHLAITDITDTSFSVAFTTIEPAVAGIKVSGPNMPESVFFASTNQEAQVSHKIYVPNLIPSTQYNFSILLQGKTILNEGNPYTVTTAPIFEDEVPTQLVEGKIITPEGENAPQVLVILSSDSSQTLSTITDQNGIFTFNIGTLRSPELTAYASLTDSSLFTIDTYYRDLASRIQIRYNNITQIPPITLSQNYDFGTLDIEEEPATSDAQFVIPTPNTTQSTFSITAPAQEQSFIDSRPTFRGTASPQTDVVIIINSQASHTVVSNATGQWQFRPQEELAQGENTISVQSKDALGVTKTLTRTFSIFPAGSQIAQTATPSATLTPTISVTISPTLSPSPSVTTTPILSPSETVSPSPTPTEIIAPTATSTPQPTVPPIITVTPTPPGSVTTVLVTFTSVILIVAGTALLFILG